ncbi:methyltransferase-domain-containing protein [Peziza echinospora]|nr:methyltransferase-domain-containing protein [Peziza echinospora]
MFSVPGWNIPSTGPAAQLPTAAEVAKKAKVTEKLKAHKAKLKHLKNASEGNHIPLGKVRTVGAGGGAGDGDEATSAVGVGGEEKEKAKKVKKGPIVNEENLQKMYEKVIEGKTGAEKRKRSGTVVGADGVAVVSGGDAAEGGDGEEKKKKKRKRGKKGSGSGAGAGEKAEQLDAEEADADAPQTQHPESSKPTSAPTPSTSSPAASPPTTTTTKSKKQKPTTSSTAVVAAPPAPAPAPAPSNLTPLQQKMRAKLTSARFRHLNEALYTTPSPSSFTLFQSQPTMFVDYHLGFRQQVQAWPENPVDIFTRQLLLRAAIKPAPKSTATGKPNHNHTALKPLPRPPPNYICTIADLGCGDAKLAEKITEECKKKKHLNLNVLSFDLSNASNPSLVTEADIAHLPLDPESVDIAIFCLALMGTNYLDFIDEAARVLRIGGEVWVAEIKSRFTTVSEAPESSSSSSSKGKNGKGATKPDVPENKGKIGVLKKTPAPPKMEDLEGDMDDPSLFTPTADAEATLTPSQIPAIYTPFIAALARRGLILKPGPASVDDSNKMFVRMEFFKPRPKPAPHASSKIPAEEEEGGDYDLRHVTRGGRGGNGGLGAQRRGKWLAKGPETEEEARGREGRILKPCVYKLR